jgi:hypothetical protein
MPGFQSGDFAGFCGRDSGCLGHRANGIRVVMSRCPNKGFLNKGDPHDFAPRVPEQGIPHKDICADIRIPSYFAGFCGQDPDKEDVVLDSAPGIPAPKPKYFRERPKKALR